MSNQNFESYYATQEDGKSLYSARFGEYAIPANEICIIASLIKQALCEDYGFKQSRKITTSLEIIKEYIGKKTNQTAKEAYDLLVKNELSGLSRAGNETEITLNLVDFGCGDGRHLPLYVSLAKELKKYNVRINLDCYDISHNALDNFKKNAIQNLSFITRDNSINFDNLSLNFIEGSHEKLPNNKKYDVGMCLFGVISYSGKDERAKIIKSLFDSSKNSVLFSVPTAKILEDKQISVTDINNDVITYKAAGQKFQYSIFQNAIDFSKEIVLATTTPNKEGFFVGEAQIPIIGEIARPTHASKDIETCFSEMANGRSYGMGEYIYCPYIMRPNEQRKVDILRNI